MNTRFCLLLGLVALGLLCAIGTAAADNTTTSSQGMQLVDDIQPYNGSIGADSSLYGLKIAFENLDESFTFNQSERLSKEIDHADLRLSELKGALATNSTGAADEALDQYWQKLNQTERTLGLFNGTRPMPGVNGTASMPAPVDTGLLHAQEMILRHQVVLENLLSSHAGNPGLSRAYDNSRNLEQRFEQKTQTQLERFQDSDNRIWVREEHMSSGPQNGTQNGNLPPYTEVRPGLTVNRMIPVVADQNREKTGPALNGAGQFPREANQSWQDLHYPAPQVIPSHTLSTSDYQENRTGNGSGTGSLADYRHDNGNTNRDTRSRNR